MGPLPAVFLLALLQPRDGAALVQRLGDDAVAARDAASRELRKRLADVESALIAGLRHADAEVRARCGDLLAELAVARRPVPPPAIGKLAFVDSKGNRAAVDRRPREGAKPGERLDVYRDGKLVGRVEITEVQAWGSWARACEGTDFASLRKGDTLSASEDP